LPGEDADEASADDHRIRQAQQRDQSVPSIADLIDLSPLSLDEEKPSSCTVLSRKADFTATRDTASSSILDDLDPLSSHVPSSNDHATMPITALRRAPDQPLRPRSASGTLHAGIEGGSPSTLPRNDWETFD